MINTFIEKQQEGKTTYLRINDYVFSEKELEQYNEMLKVSKKMVAAYNKSIQCINEQIMELQRKQAEVYKELDDKKKKLEKKFLQKVISE